MCDLARRLQGREEEEVGIVGEGNVLLGLAFENAKLDDWRRVYRTAICRRWSVLVETIGELAVGLRRTFRA